MTVSPVVMGPVLWEPLQRRPERVVAALPVLDAATGAGEQGPSWLDDAVTRASAGLAAALTAGSTDEVEAAAGSLAGLGPGSTPAGDDVLVGACHALWAGGGAWPEMARRLAARASHRTTRQSARWLAAAAAGRASAPWRTLLAAIATGPGETVARAVAVVAATGGSSGTSSLRGFRLAVAARAAVWPSAHDHRRLPDGGTP